MNQILVIYHSADFDGIFCREIARKFMPDAELIGWNFGDPKVPMPKAGTVYVLDLNPECIDFSGYSGPEAQPLDRLVWIDHHASAIAKWPEQIPGYRIDGVAACRLAWQWFRIGHHIPSGVVGEDLPNKQEFIKRTVREPITVCLAGEYDIWDKHDPRAEVFQYALRAVDPNWELLLAGGWTCNDYVTQLLIAGRTAQAYARNVDASICNSLTWLMEWEGLKFLCVNHARFNSLLFAAKDIPETGHDALLGFRYDGKKWMVSLYHAKHRTDLDLSTIAVKYGGGGHRGACGFTCAFLPFLLLSCARGLAIFPHNTANHNPTQNPMERKEMNTQIVVLDRGFVYVGKVAIEGDMVTITNAKNIRRWGTTTGLGELAVNGPTRDTKLDDAGTIVAPTRAVIHFIECKREF